MKTKKLLSWLLVLSMVFSMLPGMSLTASAFTLPTNVVAYSFKPAPDDTVEKSDSADGNYNYYTAYVYHAENEQTVSDIADLIEANGADSSKAIGAPSEYIYEPADEEYPEYQAYSGAAQGGGIPNETTEDMVDEYYLVVVYNDGSHSAYCVIPVDYWGKVDTSPIMGKGFHFDGYSDALTSDNFVDWTSVTIAPAPGTFADLQTLINNAANGDTVTLEKDYVAGDSESALAIASGKNVIIDLNGHTIDRALKSAKEAGRVITVNGTLTIKDTSQGETGKITGGYTAETKNLNRLGGGIYVADGGNFTLSGGTITGNKASAGGGVCVNSTGTFTMTGGNIEKNSAERNKSGEGKGGGVFVMGKGTFTMSGGTISENTAVCDGGGVSVYDSYCSFTMTGGTISGNTAAYRGGGVHMEKGSFKMTGGSITGNSSEYDLANPLNSSHFAGGVATSFSTKSIILGGSANITGNFQTNGTGKVMSNLLMVPDSDGYFTYIQLASGADAPIAGQMSVGVRLDLSQFYMPERKWPIANGSTGDVVWFSSDDPEYLLGFAQGDAEAFYDIETKDYLFLKYYEAPKFDLRDGSGAAAAGEAFDYNAPKWGGGETSKYTFSHWSETIDGAIAVDKTGGTNANAYDAGDFETGKKYYAVWKTGTGKDANIVLTQWVTVANNGIYLDGYQLNGTPADAATLQAYGMTYTAASGSDPIKVTMNNTVIDVQVYKPSSTYDPVVAMKLLLNTELEVTGENRIVLSGTTAAGKNVFGIKAANKLKVTGNGSLEADVSAVEIPGVGYSWGLECASYAFELGSNVTMTAKGGKSTEGYSFAMNLSRESSSIDGILNLVGGEAKYVYGMNNTNSALVIRGTLSSDANLVCGRVQLSDSGSVVLTGAKDMTVSTAYAVAQIDSSNKVISGAEVTVTGGEKSTDGKLFTKSAAGTNMVLKFHQHNFTTFEAKDNTVVATCANTDGCGLTDHKITLTLTANGGTYKNAAYTATHDDATVKFADTTKAAIAVKYVGKAPTSYSESTTAPTKTGTYTAKLIVTYGNNQTVTATKDFTISKASQSSSVTVAMNGYSYGSTPSAPTVSGTIKEGAAPTYYYNTTNSTEGGTKWENITGTTLNPGTYYLYAKLAETDNYNAFTTAAKAFTVNGLNFTSTDIKVTGYNNTYDGQAHSISVTAPTGATVTYSTDGTNYSATNPTATNAGTTTVYYKVNKTGYNEKTGSATIVINNATATSAMTTPANPFSLKAKKDATVEVTLPALPDGASYGTVTNSNSALFTVGAISNGKITVTSAKDWDKATDDSKKEFTVAVTGATNYDDYDITVTIAPMFKTKLTVSGVSMDKESYTYGDTVGYTGTVSMKNGEDAVTGITPEYTYYAKNGESWTKLDAAPTDAGDYKLVVSIPESNENYEGSQEVPFSIAKKSVTAPSANTNAFVYTGSEQTYFTIADNADYKLAEDSDAASQTNAGTYTIKLELKDTANCKWADGAVTEFTFTINPRVTVKDQTGEVVCNGVDTKLDGTYSLPTGTILKPGTYQVITELGSKTITSVLVVKDGVKPTTTVTIPTKEVSSEVEIKTTEGTPNITVTGLNTLADTYEPGANESISVTMTVEAKPADASSDAQAAIKTVNDAQPTKVSKFDFVDMSIIKESFINGTSNDKTDIHDALDVLEIIVPFTTSGRKDITVFRYHNDGTHPAETKAFDKLNERPATGFEDGKFFVGDGFLVVYARYFSEYAIGYNTVSTGGSGSSSYTITVNDAKNGTVSADEKTASAGSTVTITVTPDKGFTLETLTVLDKNGKEIEVKNLGENKYSFKMPSGKVTVSATFMEDNSMLNFFVDVHANDFYYDAVLWAAKNGITDGTDATHFSPNMGTTRAHVVTFLWRAAGCPEPKAMTSFADVEVGSYYEKAVAWALETGVTKGTSATTFSPNSICTRGQIVTFLYRYNGMDTMNIKDNPFTDVAEGQFYYDAVLWAAENSITSGTSATTFSPASNCLRGQVVTFLYRLLAK